jgi:ATP-dependent Clp endopeptidase proteolytic subunit ClpP
LYNEINAENVLDIKLRIDQYNLSQNVDGVKIKPKAIVLHINSPGGNIDSGIALMRTINKSRVPIIVYIEGMSASAATFITVTAKYRIIAPYATMMIHQYFTSITGKRNKILFESGISEKMMNIMKNIYQNFTKLPKNKLDDIMSNDAFFSTNECLKYGLVDKILKPIGKKYLDKYFRENPEYILSNDVLQKKTNFNNIYIYQQSSNDEQFYTKSFNLIADLQFILSINQPNCNVSFSNGKPKPIVIHINDTRLFKDIYEIFPMINTILLSPIPIYTIIEGGSNEMSLLFSILGYKRFIFKYVTIGIDFIYAFETNQKYEDIAQNTELARNMIKSLLKKYTKLPEKILNNIFTQRFILTAEDAIKYGLCDEIIN